MAFNVARKYKNEIEKQMQASLIHSEEEKNSTNQISKNDKIDQINYIQNLEINFLKNKNLNGMFWEKEMEDKKGKYHVKLDKPQNIDRAIMDFEGIVKYIDQNHAIAHYCLAKAYRYKGNDKFVKKHMNKLSEILSNPLNKKWVEYFDKLVPKNEVNKLKVFSNKDNTRAQLLA